MSAAHEQRKFGHLERNTDQGGVVDSHIGCRFDGVVVRRVQLEHPIMLVGDATYGVDLFTSQGVTTAFASARVDGCTSSVEDMPPGRIEALRHGPGGGKSAASRGERKVLSPCERSVNRMPDWVGDDSR